MRSPILSTLLIGAGALCPAYCQPLSLPPALATGGAWLPALLIACLTLALTAVLLQQRNLRRQLGHALEELQVFQDNAAVGMVLLRERQIQRCNRSFAEMFGYAQDELTGQSTRIFYVSEQSFADFGEAAYKAIKLGERWQIEWQLLRKDGGMLWCLMNGKALDAADLSKGVIWAMHDISDRKQAETDLKNVLQEQQAIFDNAIVGIEFVKDRKVVRCNRGWEQILGYAAGELDGQATRIYYPDDASWEQHGSIAYPLFSSKRSVVSEWEFLRKDGSRIWCSSHSKAIDPEDLGKGTIWVYQDISEQRQAEGALQQALLEQQAIFENAIAGIEFVRDHVILRCNRWMEDLLGYGRGELTGQSTRIYFRSDQSWDDYGQQTYPLIFDGETAITEWEYVRKDGSLIWCSSHGAALDSNDIGKGTVWVYQDISLRKQTEAALKTALLEQQVIFDGIKACIVIIKGDKVERLNRSMEDLLGFEHGELVGQSTRAYFWSDASHHAFSERFDPVITRGETAEGEWEFMRKDGQLIWLLFHGKAIYPQDLSQGIVFVAQDISERKRNEAALLTSKLVLERGLAEVERTHREVSLLGELSSFLQACQTAAEAYGAIAEYGPRLLPASTGALYLMDENRESLSQMLYWGEQAQGSPRTAVSFLSSECWALRRGQQYRVDAPSQVMCCPHLQVVAGDMHPYTCLPLVAQGKTFGLLFIEYRDHRPATDANVRHKLAIALAEQIGLALANIRLRDTLRQQSIRDPLTGLFNRRYMKENLTRELSKARRQKTVLALAMLDVDHFKKFNDTYGHDAGDLVLQNVAAVLQKMVRQSDVVCRFGGEEFILLLPEISDELALLRSENLLQAIRQLELRSGAQSLGRITSSLGLALYPQHAHTTESLLEKADAALYRAKGNGRDQIAIAE